METFDWIWYKKSPVYNKVLDIWRAMLEDKSLLEKDYHQFLFSHPGVFLTMLESHLVISK